MCFATWRKNGGNDRSVLIALAKLVVEATEPEEAEQVARQIGDSLPALVEHLLKTDPPH